MYEGHGFAVVKLSLLVTQENVQLLLKGRRCQGVAIRTSGLRGYPPNVINCSTQRYPESAHDGDS